MDSTLTRLAAGTGLMTLAWYAMPDLVRSRGVRTGLKVVILGAGATLTPLALQQFPDDDSIAVPDAPPAAIAALGIGVLAASTALTVWAEKAIYAYGERRRARGVRGAHTLPAIGLAALTVATIVIEGKARAA